MTVEIKEVKSRKALRTFIHLPEKIHRDHDLWVPPIFMDEKKYFNPQKNRAYSYSDATHLVAYRNGGAVGRISGIINHKYNKIRQEKHARFGWLECRNDPEVARHLLARIEDWALHQGMEKIVGPMGFTDQDPEGFLIEGFDHEPTISTYYNFPFINDLLEGEGYRKEVDYVVYLVDLTQGIPLFYTKIYQRAVRKNTCEIVEFSRRKHVKPYIRPIFRLMNECFQELYGFQPMDEEEMADLAKKYLPILDPRFIKVAVKNGQVIGFNIAMPNLSPGIRRSKGRLFPLGLIKILRSAKRTKQLDSLIGGIKKEFRGRGVDAMIGYKTIESALRAGFEYVDSHHELEENHRVRAEMERLGGRVYKRFRIYQKKLGD